MAISTPAENSTGKLIASIMIIFDDSKEIPTIVDIAYPIGTRRPAKMKSRQHPMGLANGMTPKK
jgi:hypothetical protein